MADIDVLVVGTGPAGLLTAIQLVLLGLNIRIIEKAPVALDSPRAIGFVPRTLEILTFLGLADPLLAEGLSHTYMDTYQGGLMIKRTEPYAAPTSRFHSFLSYSCGDACKHFIEELEKLGVKVEFGHELVDIDASEKGVLAVVKSLDGKDILINAKYLVGADGSRSFTRKRSGFVFEGASLDIPSMSMDVFVESDFPGIDGMAYVRNDHGTLFVCRKPNGAIRFSGERKNLEITDSNGEFSAEGTFENMKKILQPYNVEFKELEWLGSWDVNECVAQNFSKYGRVFLAGDAAHLHTPAGALGMNGGIADTYNLAWKLYLDSQNLAQPTLIDTYDTERHAIAIQAIRISGSLVRLYQATPTSGTTGHNSTVARELVSIMARNTLSFAGMLEYGANALNLFDAAAEFGIPAGHRAPDATLKKLDGAEVYLLDELPAPGVFTILVYAGTGSEQTRRELEAARGHVASPRSFINRFTVSRKQGLFHFAVVVALGTEVDRIAGAWPVYIDLMGQVKGRFAVPEERAVFFVIRPDGYVGAMFYLDEFTEIEGYFDGFLKERVE